MAFETLFSSIKFGNVTLKNRIIMAPMGVGFAPGSNQVNDMYVNYFAERAKGGVGLITVPAVAVDDTTCGIAEPGAIKLTVPEDVEGIRRICDIVHANGAKVSVQLLHPGRQGMTFWNHDQQPVAPSAIPENEYLQMPRALEKEEIASIVAKFAQAAARCVEAGADGVEIHAAHGYLISQFISPRSNKRTDEYGGSFENRMRFITEIIKAIQTVLPENCFLVVRLNATDDLPDGMTLEEGTRSIQYVAGLGVDAMSISAGTYSCKYTLIEPQLFVEGCRTSLLEHFKGKLNIPVISVNHLKRPAVAEKMLREGLCDAVALGRQMMADPAWTNKAEAGKVGQIRYCISCGYCVSCSGRGEPLKCSVNPAMSREGTWADDLLVKNGAGRKVIIIGGGPGGMEAATLAARKGFAVTLYEKTGRLGGCFDLPRVAHGMEKMAWSVDAYANRLIAEGVEVVLNHAVTDADEIAKQNPYAVIVATGGKAAVLSIPGVDNSCVVQASEVYLQPDKYTGCSAAVIGTGLTGLEVAEVLAMRGNKVEMFEIDDAIGKRITGDGAIKMSD